jgi:hypothetical protein
MRLNRPNPFWNKRRSSGSSSDHAAGRSGVENVDFSDATTSRNADPVASSSVFSRSESTSRHISSNQTTSGLTSSNKQWTSVTYSHKASRSYSRSRPSSIQDIDEAVYHSSPGVDRSANISSQSLIIHGNASNVSRQTSLPTNEEYRTSFTCNKDGLVDSGGSQLDKQNQPLTPNNGAGIYFGCLWINPMFLTGLPLKTMSELQAFPARRLQTASLFYHAAMKLSMSPSKCHSGHATGWQ